MGRHFSITEGTLVFPVYSRMGKLGREHRASSRDVDKSKNLFFVPGGGDSWECKLLLSYISFPLSAMQMQPISFFCLNNFMGWPPPPTHPLLVGPKAEIFARAPSVLFGCPFVPAWEAWELQAAGVRGLEMPQDALTPFFFSISMGHRCSQTLLTVTVTQK